VNAFEDEAKSAGFTRIISFTNNPRLHSLYDQLGFEQGDLPEYSTRRAVSPDVALFYKDIG
jgi:hypothetical protein